jgi:hypothetical protein
VDAHDEAMVTTAAPQGETPILHRRARPPLPDLPAAHLLEDVCRLRRAAKVAHQRRTGTPLKVSYREPGCADHSLIAEKPNLLQMGRCQTPSHTEAGNKKRPGVQHGLLHYVQFSVRLTNKKPQKVLIRPWKATANKPPAI